MRCCGPNPGFCADTLETEQIVIPLNVGVCVCHIVNRGQITALGGVRSLLPPYGLNLPYILNYFASPLIHFQLVLSFIYSVFTAM